MTEGRRRGGPLEGGAVDRPRGLVLARSPGFSVALALTPVSEAGDGVVRAVLFGSPDVPSLPEGAGGGPPALGDRFAGPLPGRRASTATPCGRDLYWSAFQRYGVEQRGVPLLVVGDFALVGSDDIPRRLPALVASYLAMGGVDWPPLPGLDTVLAASDAAPTPPPAPMPTPEAPVVPPPWPTRLQVSSPAPAGAGADARLPDTPGGPSHPRRTDRRFLPRRCAWRPHRSGPPSPPAPLGLPRPRRR